MSRPSEPIRFRYSLALAASLYILLFLGLIIVGYLFAFPHRIGPSQPIPFSHRFHVTQKQVSCVMCHDKVFRSDDAGIPPSETCLLCHSKIIIHYPDIAELRQYDDRREPIPWVRVGYLPDFVYFTHQMHTRSGFDCGKCHGDVAHMDRIELVHPFKMGFCISCHKRENATHDCFTCHR
jgi:hypothetical protein